MARITKSEIEGRLLAGSAISWTDTSQKQQKLQLSDAKQRRLFAFLLGSSVRKPTELPQAFIDGLAAAFSAAEDPATSRSEALLPSAAGAWRLHSIETEGFGGLNVWNGPPFRHELEEESLLLEGPNGSGKSSLTGAIVWALTGERPRDQAEGNPIIPQPVFNVDDKPAGDWPPIACYPDKVVDLKNSPSVRVTLELKDKSGAIAVIERSLSSGQVVLSIDPALQLPPVLVEAGILMPSRLTQLRLSGGSGRLTEAVQKLTGLDELISIGLLVEGLCHKGREYQSHRSKEAATAKAEFSGALQLAQQALAPVNLTVPTFTTKDTADAKSQMATFGASLKQQSAELAKVIADDIAANLDLSKMADQNAVVTAIASAEAEVKRGLAGSDTWKSLDLIASSLDDDAREALSTALALARASGAEAIRLFENGKLDARFQLKAVAAIWHAEHESGAIENCPLCKHELNFELAAELESLRSAGHAAARTFDDNATAILAALQSAIPSALRSLPEAWLQREPRTELLHQIRTRFTLNERFSSRLTGFTKLVENAMLASPSSTFFEVTSASDIDDAMLPNLSLTVVSIERLLALHSWFSATKNAWENWWDDISVGTDLDQSTPVINVQTDERLLGHLVRLSDALSKAEPYRKANEAMRAAWTAGAKAYGFELEISKRDDIGKSLLPLKQLGSLCESVAREAIDGLSGRVGALLKDMLIAENFKFRGTELNKKVGLVVRGGFSTDLRIDATLVANTSWIRAVLWCFIFALRDEAVEQLGSDRFPVVVLDDPQSTFDTFHRARWARYVASLQHAPTQVQVVITSHEELFVELVKNDGVTGREGLIAAPEAGLGHAAILEGASLDRRWKKVLTENTSTAAVDYLDRVRVFVEGVLKLMLRGEAPSVSGMVLGQLRDLLRQLNNAKKPLGTGRFLTPCSVRSNRVDPR
jgi:hypothetical protein